MKPAYHRQITLEALQQHIGASALDVVIAANLGQDALRYQFGHDHYHFDSNSFEAGNAYIETLRQAALAALARADTGAARQSFGRLTHTVQDFYAHSNYVSLWRERHPDTPAQAIEPKVEAVLADLRLCSGRLYYPLEVFSFVPGLKSLVIPLLPRDSHAWMNIDGPDRPGFPYAFAAAVKRTQAEYLRFIDGLSTEQVAQFIGNVHG